MKLNFLKTIFAAALFSGAVVGCVNNDDYDTPNEVSECIEPALVANKTVAQISAAATGSAVQYQSTTTDVIEAYVTSSDERGNFFKTISLQTMVPTGQNPVGFSVAVDETSLFAKGFKPGNKVYVILNDLYTAKVDGSLKIGALFNNTVGRIAEADYAAKIIPSCQVENESMLVRTMSIAQAKSDSNLNTLIELNNVQFVDEQIGSTLYSADNDLGGATNRTLIDANGNTIIFRTSSFATFSGATITGNSGKVRGVLTKFGSDYQFMARSGNDIQLTNPRITDENPGEEPEEPGEEPNGPSEGAAFVFPSGDFENYSAFLASLNSFGIKPYATQSAGTGRDNSNSMRIQMSSTPGNDYVFTTLAHSGLPANPTKIQFYLKGTSAKSLSFNVYQTDPLQYYKFNLDNVTVSKTVTATDANQYTGTIDTGGEWVLITLDLSGLENLNLTNTANSFFALKVGKDAAYDLHLDNFTIE